MWVRKEGGVIRYHWWLIPRLLQTKSDSMLDGGGGGDGREKETSINDKGAGHHGNRHTNKVTWYCRGEQEGGEEGESKRGFQR